MRKKKNQGIRITQRDEVFFKYLYSSRIASIKQIKRDIFPDCSREVMGRRINKLVRAKFITVVALGKMKIFKGYSITEKTFSSFIIPCYEEMNRKQWKSDSPLHDMELVDIRYFLLKKKFVKKYVPENLLQAGVGISCDIKPLVKHHPDGIVKVEIDKTIYTFCLEYDAHEKSHLRYEDIFNRYYLDKSVTAVFFITREKSLLQTLVSLERRLFTKMTPKFYYCTLDDLLSGRDEIILINQKKRRLKIE